MATVFIPSQMRDLTGGRDRVEVPGTTLREIVAALDSDFPGLASRLSNGDAVAAGLGVSIDGAFSTRGMQAKVGAESEVHFLPAIGGG